MVKNSIKPRPTFYKGIEYRSRLEATWACFFDLCGWSFRYEPMDLNGWVPDFELTSKSRKRLLVEVKPENLESFDRLELQLSAYGKCIPHLQDYDVLLLGTNVFKARDEWAIGVFVQKEACDKFWYEDKGLFDLCCCGPWTDVYKTDYACFKPDKYAPGLCPYWGIWDDVIGEAYRKSFDTEGECKLIFNTAINETKKKYI